MALIRTFLILTATLMMLGGCQRPSAPVSGMVAPSQAEAESPTATPREEPTVKDVPVTALAEEKATAPEAPGDSAPTIDDIPTAVPNPETPPSVEAETQGSDLSTTPLLPAPAIESPAISSVRHRDLFNRVAMEYYPLRWIHDTEEAHVVNVMQEELELPMALRMAMGMSDGVWQETPALHKAIALVNTELEHRRVKALQSALQAQWPVYVSTDVAISDNLRSTAKAVLELGHAVHALYLQQLDPTALAVRAEIFADADPLAVQWVQRVGVPACMQWSTDPYCSPSPKFPPLDTGNEPATPDRFAESRTTMTDHLSTLLADEQLDASLHAYLEALHTAVTSHAAEAWDHAQAAWKKTRGPFELFIGIEALKDEAEKTAVTFLWGIEHTPTSPLIAALPGARQRIESALQTVAGAAYVPRQLPEGPYVRVVDVLFASGEEKVRPSTSMPNAGPLAYAEDGKRLVCANHLTARLPLFAQIARHVLPETQRELITADAAIANAVLEQFAIDFGPRVEANTPLADILRPALAAGIAQWMIPRLAQEKLLTPSQVASLRLTHVITLLHHLRQGPSDPAYAMAELQLTHLARQGGIKPEGEGLVVDLAALPAAYDVLVRELMRAASVTDEAERHALLKEYATLLPGPMRQVLARLTDLDGPRDVTFIYQPMMP